MLALLVVDDALLDDVVLVLLLVALELPLLLPDEL